MELEQMIGELDQKILKEYRIDDDLFGELTAFQLRSGIVHGNRPICPFLRPYFLGASHYEALRKAARLLCGAFDSLTNAAVEYSELMELLGMTDAEQRFARFDTGYKSVSVTSRLDTFLSRKGFKFLEYNAENPAGVGDQAKLEEMFTGVPLIREFLAEQPHFFPQPHVRLLESLDSAYREYGGKKPVPNIAIVDWADVDTSRQNLRSSGNILCHADFPQKFAIPTNSTTTVRYCIAAILRSIFSTNG